MEEGRLAAWEAFPVLAWALSRLLAPTSIQLLVSAPLVTEAVGELRDGMEEKTAELRVTNAGLVAPAELGAEEPQGPDVAVTAVGYCGTHRMVKTEEFSEKISVVLLRNIPPHSKWYIPWVQWCRHSVCQSIPYLRQQWLPVRC